MKKYIFIAIGILLLLSVAVYAKDVFVTAKVGIQNSKPIVISVNPSNNPKLLWKNKSQSYTLYFRDDEKDPVSYSITAQSWSTNITSWNIASLDYDTASWAYISFLYFAPSLANASEKIFVTLNDGNGTGVTVKQLNLNIY